MSDFQPSHFKTHSEELDFLTSLGFPTNPLNKKVESLDDIWAYQKEIYDKKDSFQFPIDGLVVKLEDNVTSSKIGVVGKTPRTWCAIKFPAEEKSTKIKDVIWQVGRTGKLTPVAVLEPTLVAGSTVQRATLHNYKEFMESELHLDDVVIIRKAGDIIPEVVSILTNLRDKNAKVFVAPSACPSCGSALELTSTNVDLICGNTENCHEQIKLRLSYYTARNMANIVGLSDKLIERFINEFGISDIPDIYDLDWNKISQLEGLGEKSAANLQKAIENSREQKDSRFFASLGIDGVGEEVAKLILKKLYSHEHEPKTNTD
jgi:DNA ligase (NAD+)